MNLTLKQYLIGREQLLQAVNNTPVTIIEYEVRKYCTLAIGECKEESQIIPLKPRQKIIIEWDYSIPTQPSPTYIRVDDINTEINEYATFWPPEKLKRWLSRHTKEGITHVKRS